MLLLLFFPYLLKVLVKNQGFFIQWMSTKSIDTWCYATVWFKKCTIMPACVHLCEFVGLAWRCLGVCWHLPAPTVRWLAVCTVSRLTLCWLQLGLNAHLTHSLLLLCNPVEVISFTGLSTSANVGGLGGRTSVFNQPATNHSPKQNQLWWPMERPLNRRLN